VELHPTQMLTNPQNTKLHRPKNASYCTDLIFDSTPQIEVIYCTKTLKRKVATNNHQTKFTDKYKPCLLHSTNRNTALLASKNAKEARTEGVNENSNTQPCADDSYRRLLAPNVTTIPLLRTKKKVPHNAVHTGSRSEAEAVPLRSSFVLHLVMWNYTQYRCLLTHKKYQATPKNAAHCTDLIFDSTPQIEAAYCTKTLKRKVALTTTKQNLPPSTNHVCCTQQIETRRY